MEWKVKYGDEEQTVTSLNELRQCILSMPPGTRYQVEMNLPTPRNVGVVGSDITQKISQRLQQQNKLPRPSVLSGVSLRAAVIETTSKPKKRR